MLRYSRSKLPVKAKAFFEKLPRVVQIRSQKIIHHMLTQEYMDRKAFFHEAGEPYVFHHDNLATHFVVICSSFSQNGCVLIREFYPPDFIDKLAHSAIEFCRTLRQFEHQKKYTSKDYRKIWRFEMTSTAPMEGINHW